jgi:hypothetical protein
MDFPRRRSSRGNGWNAVAMIPVVTGTGSPTLAVGAVSVSKHQTSDIASAPLLDNRHPAIAVVLRPVTPPKNARIPQPRAGPPGRRPCAKDNWIHCGSSSPGRKPGCRSLRWEARACANTPGPATLAGAQNASDRPCPNAAAAAPRDCRARIRRRTAAREPERHSWAGVPASPAPMEAQNKTPGANPPAFSSATDMMPALV